MFGSDGVQLIQRMAGARPLRSDRRLPLRSEHFPVEARGREIVTQQGLTIAVGRSCDERGDSSAPEQERLERPRGSMGALTGVRSRQKMLTRPTSRPRWLI